MRYRVSTSGPWTTDAGHSGTALTLTLTGLTAETTYQVQVQATNAEGPGDWSAAATATTSAPPSVTVSESAVTVPEGGSAAYTIVLDTEPSAAVTVTVSASGDSDLTASPTTLAFTRSNWNDAQTVTVSASPDDDATNGEATVVHRATGGGYGPVSIASVTATEEDDDRVGSAETAAVKHSMSGLARGMLSSAEMMMSSRFRRSEGYGPAREMRIGGESLSVSRQSVSLGSQSWSVSRQSVSLGGQSLSLGRIDPKAFFENMLMDLERSASGYMSSMRPEAGVPDSGPGAMASGGRAPKFGFRPVSLPDLRFRAPSTSGRGSSWLEGTSFELPLGRSGRPATDGSAAPGGNRWTLWGQGDVQSFNVGGASRSSGEVRSAYLGLDAGLGGGWLAGSSLWMSRGESDYSFSDAEATGSGRVATRMTGVYPYLQKRWSNASKLWGIAGAGRGTGASVRDGHPAAEDADLSMEMGMVGGQHTLGRSGGMRLSAVGDAALLRLRSSAPDTLLNPLADLLVSVHRFRLGLEGSLDMQLGPGGVSAFGQLSARQDGGDGSTGAGVDMSGGVRYGSGRVELEAGGRYLLLHTADDWSEHGFNVALQVRPGADGRGLSASVAPTWGRSAGAPSAPEGLDAPTTSAMTATGLNASGATAMWGPDALLGYGGRGGAGKSSLESQVAYGLALPFSGSTLVTPSMSYSRISSGDTRVKLLMQLHHQGSGTLQFRIRAEHSLGSATSMAGRQALRLMLHKAF